MWFSPGYIVDCDSERNWNQPVDVDDIAVDETAIVVVVCHVVAEDGQPLASIQRFGRLTDKYRQANTLKNKRKGATKKVLTEIKDLCWYVNNQKLNKLIGNNLIISSVVAASFDNTICSITYLEDIRFKKYSWWRQIIKH